MENGKIGLRQFSILMFLFTVGSSILLLPPTIATIARQDAWLSTLIGLGTSFFIIPIYIVLGLRFSNMTLMEYSEAILGKWSGKLVAFSFFVYFFLLATIVLRNIGDFITTKIMPETPIESIHIIFLSIVILGAYLGLETIARSSEIFFPIVLILFIMLIVFVLPEIKFENLLPFLDEGIKPVLHGSLLFMGSPLLETVIFLMILPYINKPKPAVKAGINGFLLGGISLVIVTTLTILVLGYQLTAIHTFPSYALAKKINIGNFLERIEAIMAGIWFLSIYYKLTICFYASALGLAQILKLSSYRPLLIPLGMIATVMALVIYPNFSYYINFFTEIWVFYAMTYGFFIPLFLLIVALLRGKKSSPAASLKK